MLTRIEIDGFKSFEDFALDLAPFTVIAGPNATGKSNLFDLIRLLSALARENVSTALRSARGDPSDQFRIRSPGDQAERMRIAVEVLLPAEVADPLGGRATIDHRRIRYEVTLGRRRNGGMERVVVEEEAAAPIQKSSDTWLDSLPKSSPLREVAYRRSVKKPLLETRSEGSGKVVRISQIGHQGRPRTYPALDATETALSTTISTVEFPHLLALKQMLASLRFLQLDPSSERKPADILSQGTLEPDGRNLAAVLYRIREETRDEIRPEGVLADIRAALGTFIPAVSSLDVERDDNARQYRFALNMVDGNRFTSGVLSDGTLRLLGLLAVLFDPEWTGILCFEEPENGIHAGRVAALVELLVDVTDPATAVSAPRQVLVNTHSPEVAKSAPYLVSAMTLSRRSSEGAVLRRSNMISGVKDGLPLGDAAAPTRVDVTRQLREPSEAP